MKLLAAALFMTVASQALAADPTTLCTRLAAQARTVKDAAWGARAETALQPALQIDKLNNHPSPFEAALADLPAVKEAVGYNASTYLWTDHLPGTDVYSVSTIEGTLHCQGASFLKAGKGEKPKIIDAPPTSEDGEGLCWTQSGEFGRLYGQPAFFAHGTVNDHVFDTSIEVTPWIGGGWAQGCEVDLKFRTSQRLVEHHCEDEDLCLAAEDIARAAAVAYNAYRVNDAVNLKNKDAHFRIGLAAPEPFEAAAQRLAKPNDGHTPEFPFFGPRPTDGHSGGFSYSGLEFFPIFLKGQWFVAAIGHDGVGWRESGRTLLAVYTEQSGGLTPKAGFVFDAVNDGLAEASVQVLPKDAH